MPFISVVIPTYNRAEFVTRAVYSVYKQSFDDFEIVVVDDCSRDDTAARLERLTQSCPGLKRKLIYRRQSENRGANAARNLGIQLAHGEHIAFLDSDDIWHPLKLERQVERMQQEQHKNQGNRPFFSFTGRYRVDGDYNVIAKQFPGSMRNAERRIRRINVIGTLSTVMISTWLARHIRGFDERLAACQDWDFFVRSIPYCHVFGVPEPLVMYYDGHIDRISSNGRKRLAAHLVMYRKYLRGRSDPRELSELYRNISEDLERLGKVRMARRFYQTHKWYSGEYREALTMALGFGEPTVLAERYAKYAQMEANRSGLDRIQDEPYLESYRLLLAAGVPLAEAPGLAR
jgi:glycosyltransferase involved in cell wall biosynthesis